MVGEDGRGHVPLLIPLVRWNLEYYVSVLFVPCFISVRVSSNIFFRTHGPIVTIPYRLCEVKPTSYTSPNCLVLFDWFPSLTTEPTFRFPKTKKVIHSLSVTSVTSYLGLRVVLESRSPTYPLTVFRLFSHFYETLPTITEVNIPGLTLVSIPLFSVLDE